MSGTATWRSGDRHSHPQLPLTRLATVGQPDVVPLAFEFDAHGFWVGGVGDAVARTRKFRNVAAGNDRVALVFDDLISLDPFGARFLRVYGRAGEISMR